MKRHAKVIIAYPTPWFEVPSSFSRAKWPSEAKTRKHMNIHKAPVISAGLRPNFSTIYRPGKVMPKLTPPRIMEVTNEFEIPTDRKIVVP
jgi:hypothetical protein